MNKLCGNPQHTLRTTRNITGSWIMDEQPTSRQWQTIEIPANDFNNRLNQVIEDQASSGTLFSRLALIHQVAKAFASETIGKEKSTLIDIEEITDPPLYGYMPDDEPVVILFSY